MPQYDIQEQPMEMIINGPYPLNHEGRLRGPFRPGSGGTEQQKRAMIAGTRRHGTNYSRARNVMTPCGHWAEMAYNVFVPELPGGGNGWCLGIRFVGGFRCYYPNTASPQENNPYFHDIKSAESGSYWVWDNLVDKPLGDGYVAF